MPHRTARSTGTRTAITAAAYACIAERGYERTSTAEICRLAGVSSGTFFHHFPTKAAVLAGVLAEGLTVTEEVFTRLRATAADDAATALAGWAAHVVAEARDPHYPGFAAALATAPDETEVSRLLERESGLVTDLLTTLVAAAQQQGLARTDQAAAELAGWLQVLAEGLLALHADPRAGQRPRAEDLLLTARRLLRPDPPPAAPGG